MAPKTDVIAELRARVAELEVSLANEKQDYIECEQMLHSERDIWQTEREQLTGKVSELEAENARLKERAEVAEKFADSENESITKQLLLAQADSIGWLTTALSAIKKDEVDEWRTFPGRHQIRLLHDGTGHPRASFLRQPPHAADTHLLRYRPVAITLRGRHVQDTGRYEAGDCMRTPFKDWLFNPVIMAVLFCAGLAVSISLAVLISRYMILPCIIALTVYLTEGCLYWRQGDHH